MPYCEKHPKFVGQRKPTSKGCGECIEVFEASGALREELGRIRRGLTKGKAKLRSVGEAFKPGSADHWRFILFDELGLGLRPSKRTKKTRVPCVDPESIDKLVRKYPDVELLKYRAELARSRYRLDNVLSIEPEGDGRVHFEYSFHRTFSSRGSSGADDSEPSKLRVSTAGNAQNKKDRDRRMFVAPAGMEFIQADWSQIEARCMAWHAGETRMLTAWAEGKDLHSINAAALGQALAKHDPRAWAAYRDANVDNVRKLPSPINRGDSLRDAGKVLTHAWDYGMQAEKTAADFGLPLPVAVALREAYFAQWPGLRRFQGWVEEQINEHRTLTNAFGRKVEFFNFEYDPARGVWRTSDLEQGLSFIPQSDVADMLKAVLPDVARIAGENGGRLVTQTHDSVLVESWPAKREKVVDAIRKTMERKWPEMGTVAGFGSFWCPADFAVGLNWGKYKACEGHEDATCSGTGTCNGRGLKEVAA